MRLPYYAGGQRRQVVGYSPVKSPSDGFSGGIDMTLSWGHNQRYLRDALGRDLLGQLLVEVRPTMRRKVWVIVKERFCKEVKNADCRAKST